MTKLYIKSDAGLFVEENGEQKPLDGSNDYKSALSILTDALGDAERARALHIRFMHRVIRLSPKGFRHSLERILAEAADIEKVETQTAMTRAMVAREPAPIVSDRGAGIVWDMEHK